MEFYKDLDHCNHTYNQPLLYTNLNRPTPYITPYITPYPSRFSIAFIIYSYLLWEFFRGLFYYYRILFVLHRLYCREKLLLQYKKLNSNVSTCVQIRINGNIYNGKIQHVSYCELNINPIVCVYMNWYHRSNNNIPIWLFVNSDFTIKYHTCSHRKFMVHYLAFRYMIPDDVISSIIVYVCDCNDICIRAPGTCKC